MKPRALSLILAAASGATCAQVLRGQTPLWTQAFANSSFGEHMAVLGDLNGDGHSDLAVGASAWPWTGSGPCCWGKAFVISGLNGAFLMEKTGSAPLSLFGWKSSGPGDVTGDGVPDLFIGSGGLGQAFLYSGADGSSVYVFNVPAGLSTGSPGDSNGDGVPDLLVGAGSIGQVYLHSGADGGLLQTIPTSPVGFCPLFGNEVEGLGDLDGDGLGDFIVGAPWHGTCFPFYGEAFVYSGGSGQQIGAPQGPMLVYDKFGLAAASVGDATGDGVPDFAVGSVGSFGGPYPGQNGQVRVFSGADMTVLAVLLGQGTEGLGWSVAGAGDVDGDAIPDLVAGAPGALPFVLNLGVAGRAVVYSGADWSELMVHVPPPNQAWRLGGAAATLGDINGDDFPDLALGAPSSTLAPLGKVLAYSGAPEGVSSFGAGCASASGVVPRIGATRSPRIGTTFSINLSRTQAGRSSVLLLGLSNAQWWGIPLPLDLAFVGLPGCSLLVSPDLPVGLTTSAFGGNGRAIAPIALPGDASLVGASFYAQWYVADSVSAPFPGAVTRGLAATLQP